jgi:hypothetical protein
VSKGDSSSGKPSWFPSWLPEHDTVEYLSVLLTAGLLVLVTAYLIHSIASGRLKMQHGATVAAGVGVGGAGT